MRVLSIPEVLRVIDNSIKYIKKPLQLFVKSTIPKKFAFPIIKDNLEETLDILYSFAMQYEDDDICLLQDLIPMEHEIRFIVFNGKIISCSAQVDEYTPLVNCYKDRWFIKTQKIRKEHNRHSSPIDTQDFYKMVGKAVRIVTELATENILDYSLDMCMSNGKPTLVEINPLCNSGLFGNDYERFVLAIKNFYLNI